MHQISEGHQLPSWFHIAMQLKKTLKPPISFNTNQATV